MAECDAGREKRQDHAESDELERGERAAGVPDGDDAGAPLTRTAERPVGDHPRRDHGPGHRSREVREKRHIDPEARSDARVPWPRAVHPAGNGVAPSRGAGERFLGAQIPVVTTFHSGKLTRDFPYRQVMAPRVTGLGLTASAAPRPPRATAPSSATTSKTRSARAGLVVLDGESRERHQHARGLDRAHALHLRHGRRAGARMGRARRRVLGEGRRRVAPLRVERVVDPAAHERPQQARRRAAPLVGDRRGRHQRDRPPVSPHVGAELHVDPAQRVTSSDPARRRRPTRPSGRTCPCRDPVEVSRSRPGARGGSYPSPANSVRPSAEPRARPPPCPGSRREETRATPGTRRRGGRRPRRPWRRASPRAAPCRPGPTPCTAPRCATARGAVPRPSPGSSPA